MPVRMRSICIKPDSSRFGKSIWVLSPVITVLEFTRDA
jgi:hypothetical protein